MRYKKEKSSPYPLGVQKIENGIHFAVVLSEKESQGMILYMKNKGHGMKIPFSKENLCGSIYCGNIIGIDTTDTTYMFYQDDIFLTDVAGQAFVGLEKALNTLCINGFCSYIEEKYYISKDKFKNVNHYKNQIMFANENDFINGWEAFAKKNSDVCELYSRAKI